MHCWVPLQCCCFDDGRSRFPRDTIENTTPPRTIWVHADRCEHLNRKHGWIYWADEALAGEIDHLTNAPMLTSKCRSAPIFDKAADGPRTHEIPESSESFTKHCPHPRTSQTAASHEMIAIEPQSPGVGIMPPPFNVPGSLVQCFVVFGCQPEPNHITQLTSFCETA